MYLLHVENVLLKKKKESSKSNMAHKTTYFITRDNAWHAIFYYNWTQENRYNDNRQWVNKKRKKKISLYGLWSTDLRKSISGRFYPAKSMLV